MDSSSDPGGLEGDEEGVRFKVGTSTATLDFHSSDCPVGTFYTVKEETSDAGTVRLDVGADVPASRSGSAPDDRFFGGPQV